MTPVRDINERKSSNFFRIEWISETGSTNQDVIERAKKGEKEGLVLVADHQSAGRGRRDRSWVAPPQSALLFTILLRPNIEVDELHWLTPLLALSAQGAIGDLFGVEVVLKWPNDLLVNTAKGHRKLGGILGEIVSETGENSAVIGMGLNVAWPAEVPAEIAEIAVALSEVSNDLLGREEILDAVLIGVEKRYHTLVGNGPEELRREYEARCFTIGQEVRVDLVEQHLIGIATGVGTSGQLIVESEPGNSVEVMAGDVVHLRSET